MNKEAMKLALEALKYPLNQSHENFNVDMAELLAHRAITAIEEALAQPEQEPVAFICEFYADEGHPFVSFEPVTHGTNTPLYASPPQRNPLTRKEVLTIIDKHPAEKKTGLPMFYRDQVLDIARAIEAAHGIKGDA